MKTFVRIATALERIAKALENITGTTQYVAAPGQFKPVDQCLVCVATHIPGVMCPKLVVQ